MVRHLFSPGNLKSAATELYHSLMPLPLEETLIPVLMPHRRRRLPLLAAGVDGDHPVARLAAFVRERGFLDRLLRDATDAPGAVELVDVIAGDGLLRVRGPFQLGQVTLLAQEHVRRF